MSERHQVMCVGLNTLTTRWCDMRHLDTSDWIALWIGFVFCVSLASGPYRPDSTSRRAFYGDVSDRGPAMTIDSLEPRSPGTNDEP